MKFKLLIILCLCACTIWAKEKVTYLSSDGIRITADLYISDKSNPFILLFHQSNSSRGEYNQIVPKLLKLNYNCLAVDLRAGGSMNYVKNETHEQALKTQKSTAFTDALKDIDASIEFIRRYTHRQLILLGSSYSASLCLINAVNNHDIQAVIAFSPGEYFKPEINVKEEISGFSKPLFYTGSKIEFKYIENLLSNVNKKHVMYFKPSGDGAHGSKILWPNTNEGKACWLQLSMFLDRLN